jgi:hypothetical protein
LRVIRVFGKRIFGKTFHRFFSCDDVEKKTLEFIQVAVGFVKYVKIGFFKIEP